MMKNDTSTSPDLPPAFVTRKESAAPPMLQVETARETYLFPLPALQRVRFPVAEGQLTLYFPGWLVIISGRNLAPLREALRHWSVTHIREQGREAEALSTEKTVVRELLVRRARRDDE
jgi:hypothetical protein